MTTTTKNRVLILRQLADKLEAGTYEFVGDGLETFRRDGVGYYHIDLFDPQRHELCNREMAEKKAAIYCQQCGGRRTDD